MMHLQGELENILFFQNYISISINKMKIKYLGYKKKPFLVLIENMIFEF